MEAANVANNTTTQRRREVRKKLATARKCERELKESSDPAETITKTRRLRRAERSWKRDILRVELPSVRKKRSFNC